MNNWKIILSFTYPHEVHIVKGRLESEGIPVQIKDELTAQVNNFYSNAIGGVKLLVQEKDYERALEILIETGQINRPTKTENKLLIQIDRISSKLPLLGKSRIELRLILIIALLLMIIITPFAIMSIPTTLEKLTNNSWCVDKIYYLGQELTPNSNGIKRIREYDNCRETINFRKSGIVDFPGIDSYRDRARWKYKNDTLIITKYSIENNYTIGENIGITGNEKNIKKSIVPGKYRLEIKDNRIKLQSDSLIILGKAHRFNFKF